MARTEAQKRADAKYEEKRRGTKHRGWLAVFYPESVAENWRDLLTTEGVPAYVSPLHNSDVNADGTPKKPHHHVLLLWDGPTTYETAKPIFDVIGAVMPPKNPKPGECKPWAVTVRGAARYLCHLDNPEKAQYDPNEVQTFNATLADYFDLINSAGDDDAVLDEITDFIDENSVVSFAAFVRYCKQERPEWKRLAYHKYAAFITRYIKSVAWEGSPSRQEMMQYQQEREEIEREAAKRAREKAELEAGNWAMSTVEYIASNLQKSQDPKNAPAESGPVCSWCGAPAVGGSVGPDGAFYWCDEHEETGRRLAESMPDNL